MTLYDHDFGLGNRLLHRMALSAPWLAQLSFDLDQRSSGAAAEADNLSRRPHVFVTGLARAGTTVLLRAFHDDGQFRSLTYRNMPFPLAPNLWARLSARWQQQDAERERAHGDRIKVSSDSPEALEQVFWKVETGSDYIRRDGLYAYTPDEEAMRRFQRYVTAILLSGRPHQWRYLSKNNNNILRLPALLNAFPEASFVIPFRHPAEQAMSLWRQHQHFCAMQRRAPFVRTYMDWLVHHEFGLGHRPYLLGGRPETGLGPDQPDYWLETWHRVYRRLSTISDRRCLFVCYEDLCAGPDLWCVLARRLDLLDPDKAQTFQANAPSKEGLFDTGRLIAAEATYEALRQRSRAELFMPDVSKDLACRSATAAVVGQPS